MKQTFFRFYEAVLEGGEGPVPYGEILRVTEIMDRIFAECRKGDADRSEKKRRSRQAKSAIQMQDRSTDGTEEFLAELSAGNG